MMILPLLGIVLAFGSPSFVEVFPRGGQRGTQVDCEIRGNRLADIQSLLFYQEGLELLSLEPLNEKKAKARIRIQDDCALGEHRLRVQTATGISELRTFWVGPYPCIDEAEPNSSLTQAQPISLGQTIQGTVTAEDTDTFVIALEEGQRLSLEVEGIRLADTLFDPYLALFDETGERLAQCDDSTLLLQDPHLSYRAPRSQRIFVQLRETSYGGSPRCRYRMHVGSFRRPTIAFPLGGRSSQEREVVLLGDLDGPIETTYVSSMEVRGAIDAIHYQDPQGICPSSVPYRVCEFDDVFEVEPNDSRREPQVVELPVPFAVNGRMDKNRDQDYFRFGAKKGERLYIRVLARSLRSPMDSVITLFRADGGRVAANDDANSLIDSALEFNPPEDGEYVVRIRDHLSRGGETFVYRLEVLRMETFLWSLTPRFGRDSQARQAIPVPRGGRYASMFRVGRARHREDVDFHFTDLPDGVTVKASTVARDLDLVPIIFEASPSSKLGASLSSLTLTSKRGDESIEGRYIQDLELVVAPPNRTVYYKTRVDRLPVVACEPVPFALELDAPKVPLVRNGALSLRVRAKREPGFEGPITLRLLCGVSGVSSSATVSLPKDKDEIVYPINANNAARLGEAPLVVLGEAETGRGLVFTSTGYQWLSVVEPSLSVSLQMAAIPKGGEGEVVGQVELLEAFEGKARIALRGLPAGVTSEAQSLDRNAEEVVFPLKVSADANPGQTKGLFCQIFVPHPEGQLAHASGHGGVLRVDPPSKDSKGSQAKPKKQARTGRRLSRLEQLREAAKEEKEGGQR